MKKSKLSLLCSLAWLLFMSITAHAQKISTIAGGRGDDGRQATSVSIRPGGGVFDSSGNFYFSEPEFARVRKLSTDGTLSTIAGNGARGYSGDGQVATSASLNSPASLAIDQNDNLYIADVLNSRIRKINSQGIISTYAGNGSFGSSGDGGQAVSASFMQPSGIALDALGNLYVADSSARKIRRVSPAGVITTIAGTGSIGSSGDGGLATDATFKQPTNLAVDTTGNLYISDPADNRIRRVDSAGLITAFAGNGSTGFSGDGGSAISASLYVPLGIAADSAGRLLVADRVNGRIRVIGTDGIINTFAGNGSFVYGGDGGQASSASFREVLSVAVSPSGDVFVSESGGGRIRKILANGVITTIAGEGSLTGGDAGLPSSKASLSYPSAVSTDVAGNAYIADLSNYAVRKVDASGNTTTVAGGGEAASLGDGGPATQALVFSPTGVAADGDGNLYISAYYRIRKVSVSGIITTLFGNDSYQFGGDGGPAIFASGDPRGLAVDAQGNIYFADTTSNRVRRISAGGTVTTVAGTGTAGYSGDSVPAVSAQLNLPMGVAVDTAGRIYVAEAGSRRIRRIDTDGNIRTVAGNGGYGSYGDGGAAEYAALSNVHGVAVDSAGYIYIADFGNNRIRQVDPAGIITTIAGTGAAGFFGDGASATLAGLNGPKSVAVLGSSQILVADYSNNRVRKISFEPPSAPGGIQVQAGNSQVVVQFGVPGNNGGRAILDYTATCTSINPANSISTTGTASPIVVTGLSNFVTYTCTVAARNAIGTGPASLASGSVTLNNGPYLLITSRSGSGSGSITSAPLGINCGFACAVNVASGTSVTLTAVPVAGSAFTGWTGVACNGGNSALSCTFSMTGSANATAQFKKLLTVGPTWTTSGTFGQTVTFAQSICAGDEGIAAGQLTLQYNISGSGATASLVVDRNGNGQVDAGEVQDWSAVISDSLAAGTCLPVLLRVTLPYGGNLGDVYGVTWGARLPSMPSGEYVQTTADAYLLRNRVFYNFTIVGQGGLKYGSSVFRNVFTMEFKDPSSIEFMAVPDAGWVVAGWSGITCANPDTSTYCVVLPQPLTQPITEFNVTLTFVQLPLSSTTAGDMNDDGRSDIVWRNSSTGENWYWAMNGNTITAQGPITTLPVDWQIQSTAVDFDGDGKSDILLRNMTTGQPWIWFMNGNSIIGGGALPTLSDLNWIIAGTGDLNGDGKGDVVWRNTSTGQNWWWALNGTSIINQGQITALPPEWVIQSTLGDFNGDGKTDILWRNMTTGQPWVWMMDSNNLIANGPLPTLSDLNWIIAGTGDLNGDGKHDVVWRNTSTGANWYWSLNGTTITAQGPITTLPTDWQIQSTSADFDGDGKADILLRNATTGQPWVWFMNGNTITGGGPLPTLSDVSWQIRIRK